MKGKTKGKTGRKDKEDKRRGSKRKRGVEEEWGRREEGKGNRSKTKKESEQ